MVFEDFYHKFLQVVNMHAIVSTSSLGGGRPPPSPPATPLCTIMKWTFYFSPSYTSHKTSLLIHASKWYALLKCCIKYLHSQPVFLDMILILFQINDAFNGITALLSASFHCSVDAVKFLIRRGADVELTVSLKR